MSFAQPAKQNMSRTCANSSLDNAFNGPFTCRFAPSPTGRMHAGNIFSALVSWLIARSTGGTVVLRIEDLDAERSRPEYVLSLLQDFESLGLSWDRGPYFQHDRSQAYQSAYEQLAGSGLVYPCFCSRAEIHAASAPHFGEKVVYAGTCRGLNPAVVRAKSTQRTPAQRLIAPSKKFGVNDVFQGWYCQNLASDCGDFIVKRSDGAFAYQLAVVVDDAAQGVNCVVRGIDLLCSTPQQLYLQELLGFDQPQYAHIPLLVSSENKRLSKRDKSASLDELLATYKTPAGVIGHIAYVGGLQETDCPAMPKELLKMFNLSELQSAYCGRDQIMWH